MVAEYQSFCHLELKHSRIAEIHGPFKGVYAPNKPRHQAKRIGPGKPRPPRPTLDQLTEHLFHPSPRKRRQAAETLCRQFKPHNPRNERPDLVESLSLILRVSTEDHVRRAAALTLGTYGDAEAIFPLVDALKSPAIAPHALDALFYLNMYYQSPQIADAVCNFLSKSQHPTSNMTAINILQDYRDPRLVAIALRIIDDPDTEQQTRFTAAFAVAQVSKRAADEFISRFTHPNPDVREVAVAAIRETHDKRALRPLQRALKDESPAVRNQVQMSITFLSPQ
jgi:HEAT repeat protein